MNPRLEAEKQKIAQSEIEMRNEGNRWMLTKDHLTMHVELPNEYPMVKPKICIFW